MVATLTRPVTPIFRRAIMSLFQFAPGVACTCALAAVILISGCTGTMKRVSVSTAGEQGDGRSYYGRISGNGRFVAFVSEANNFVNPQILRPDGTAGTNVYVRDLSKETTRIVSISNDGTIDGNAVGRPDISENGRFIVWASASSHLVPRDGNSRTDIFLRDRDLNVTMRISLGTDWSVGAVDVESNGHSRNPAISPDGAMIAFESDATNLVRDAANPGREDTNGDTDVFIRSFFGSASVSVLPTDPTGIALTDRASLRFTFSGTVQIQGDTSNPDIGATVLDARVAPIVVQSDGNLFGFQADTNNLPDIYYRRSGLSLFSRLSDAISDQQTDGASLRPSMGNEESSHAFATDATNIHEIPLTGSVDVNGVRDVMVVTATPMAPLPIDIKRASDSESGVQGDGPSDFPELSWLGNYVTFQSNATNLIDTQPDGNGVTDVFLRNNANGKIMVVSRAFDRTDANGHSRRPSVSNTGERVTFTSDATNLLDPASTDADTNGLTDVYVYFRFLKGKFWLWPFDWPFTWDGELD